VSAFAAQGGNTEADDDATTAIGELFSRSQPGSMVTKFLIIAVAIDEDGDEVISTFTSQGLRRWDSLGMLAFAQQMEDGRTVLDDEEDE
jgi:hypothetical protein